MLQICGRCGEWIEEVTVTEEAALVCPHCGDRQPFVRLPLFQVTGASGSGKSRVARDLPAALPDCVVLDQDVLWHGVHTPEQLEAYRRRWLRLATSIGQGGRAVVLLSTVLPEHYEKQPERALFAEIHYLALVCDDDELAERLAARPAWRGVTEEEISRMRAFNAWLQANGRRTDPPMTLLDTTGADPEETVAAVAEWVRTRLA
jgi:predicted kinase